MTELAPGARASTPPKSRTKSAAPTGDDALATDIMVVKVGGSVLNGPDDVAKAVSEAYRRARTGRRVLLVVSALEGETDALLAQAETYGDRSDNPFLPELVALGERRSAALVAMACDKVGLRTMLVDPASIGLRARGDRAAADVVEIDGAALRAYLADHDVVVAPGFIADGDDGRVMLLGRGGSDLTAVLLADAVGLKAVRLIKDVDGVYEADPSDRMGRPARRFDAMTWAQARKLGAAVVQERAIAAAEDRKLAVHVSAVGAERVTVIADRAAEPRFAEPVRPLRVALAGFGVVGGGVFQRLSQEPDAYQVTGILVRDPGRRRVTPAPAALLTADRDTLLAGAPDIVVDALSDGDTGLAITRAALEAGVSVASANKQAIVADIAALTALAAKTGARLGYSAAVGGGAPMIETMRAARAHGEIAGFEAVLNGTVNFILDRMAHGVSYEDALAEARRAGFAEEDPSADLDGLDAAAKVRILAFEAYGVDPGEAAVPREPLDAGACARVSARGGVWKQVGSCAAEGDRLLARVAFEPAASDSPFAAARGERNALRVVTRDGRVFLARGRGAGRAPTSEAVFADLVDARVALLDA